MCGIAGFWAAPGKSGEELANLARGMADRLGHRGPDAKGAWADPAAGCALGHRRLAIIDLSPGGSQPMTSADGNLVISYNGEIYNYQQIRDELEQEGVIAWRGTSDTEVLLEAVARWGLAATLKRANGMFALALWDKKNRTLSLARDRLGIKPLYYGHGGGAFLFASELKALHAFPGFGPELDRGVLALFLRHGYIPGPHCIFSGVKKLPPGSILEIKNPDPAHLPEPKRYWSFEEAARNGLMNPFEGSPEEAVDALEGLLADAVKKRMVADVPLGAFLSGGIDSSAVVSLMQSQSPKPVKTFCIGFREQRFDEAAHARKVAEHLGTDHTELYLGWDQALDTVPELPALYDEPFADPSQIPTYLVSRLARGEVTVSLSGDGGDELFAGYNTYAWMRAIARGPGRLPRFLRSGIAASLSAISASAWDRLIPGRNAGQRLHRLAEVLGGEDLDGMYRRMVSHWQDASRLAGAKEPPTCFSAPADRGVFKDIAERAMLLDGTGYLPDDILVKLDRASMAVALEARVPVLDHRVVELAWRIPLSMKLKDGKSKWPLRQVLHRHVPAHLVERPKQGFAVPVGEWLKGPLKEWAGDILNRDGLAGQGLLDADMVAARWEEHLAGGRNWQYPLWNVLMFQQWHRAWKA